MINPALVFPGDMTAAVEDAPLSEPGPGQLLLETNISLISIGTELAVLGQAAGADPAWAWAQFPFRPGYNNIARVSKTGPNLSPALVGKRVASYAPHARLCVIDVAQARFIPDEVSDEDAAFFTFAEIVMNGLRRARLKMGESVAVFGAGLLGQIAVRLAYAGGASVVFGVDPSPARRALLPTLPGIVPVDPGAGSLPEQIKAHNHGRLCDLVVELTGNAQAIPGEFAALRPQGRFLLLSSPTSRIDFDFNALCNVPSISIIGAHNKSHPKASTPDNPWTQARNAEMFFDLLATGRINLQGLVTSRVGYAQAPAIYHQLLKDRSQAMGIMLDWTR